jgi:hypothetical protein
VELGGPCAFAAFDLVVGTVVARPDEGGEPLPGLLDDGDDDTVAAGAAGAAVVGVL